MILAPHLLVGAAIVLKVQPLPLAIILAVVSHYLLDTLPHSEYQIREIKERNWSKSFLSFAKVALDIIFGVLVILIFAKNYPTALLGGFFGILPDGLTFLGFLWTGNRFLRIHSRFHLEKTGFLNNKKISFFLRNFSQILVITIAIFFLL